MASDPDETCIRAVRFVHGPGNVRFPIQNVFPRQNSLSGGPAAGVGGVAAAGKDSMLPCRGWPKGVLNFDQPTKRQRMADVIEVTTASGSDTATAGKDTTAAGMDTAAGNKTAWTQRHGHSDSRHGHDCTAANKTDAHGSGY